MKIYKLKTLIFATVTLLVSLTGCESLVNEVDPKRIPQNEQKLVINCYISPQDSLIVAKLQYSGVVFQTRSYDSNNYQSPEIIATDVQIEISEGGKSIALKYDVKEKLYIASTKNFKIEAGKTYELKAVDGKKRNYSAKTTVPTPIDFTIQKPFQTATPNQFEQAKYWQVPISWTAPANSYFRFGLWDTKRSEFKGADGKVTRVESTPANGFWENKFERNNENVSRVLNSFSNYYEYIYPPNVQNNEKIVRRAMRFMRIDKNYNDFSRSISMSFGNGNPFVEPTLVASSIENGYGCFGSYFQMDKEYQFE